jgi:putative transposase
MSRPPRVQVPGGLYHVTARGDNREPIFLDDRDREKHLGLLDEVVLHEEWSCFAYCLMTNHFHLLIETPEPNIAHGMQALNGRYAQRFNRRHGRVGHLFERRYDSVLIESDCHLAEVERYIVLNPFRAQLRQRAEDWPWSSYRATAGLARAPRFLDVDRVLMEFGRDPRVGRARYADFVADGSPAASLAGLLVAA